MDGVRVVTIVLLLMFLALWLVNWSMSIIGVTVLCLVIGFVSPLLAFGDVHPFAPLWLRLTLIGLILLTYALYGLYRLWRALRLDEQLLRRFLHPRGEDVPVAGEIKADLRTVSHIVTRAIRQLKQLRVDLPGWRKVLEGKRFLYELPWFMVIGSPGDGKTTALLNTGLQFPLAEQMEQTAHTLNLGYVSPAANLPLQPMVGKDLCVSIELDGGGKRYISGLVTATRVVGHEGRSVTYELRIEPWLKLLTHTSDYKAFQNKTVVDILDEVLDEYSFPVEKRLVENYPPRAWQVQYGETDFDFIQRLMQEWGIYWWFEHSENSHTLVLADAINGHKACPDSPLVEWHQEGLKLDKEFIHTITASERLRTGKWVMDDFDFMKPRSLLKSTVASPRDTGHAEYEHYEWPGDYFTTGEGEMLTRIRMEAQRSPGSRAHGAGHIRTLMMGYTFTLMNHPTAEVNQEYLLVQTTLFLRDNAQHSGQEQHFTYVTTFELHPTSEVYRPQRTLSKPHTKGPQSAIVTGPAGQEIWTDKYGRVKVQFGWDRYGNNDENSSCWIRVSYPWAGKGFGMIQIPRIGQEVLVDFKNGDPDLPIIVGRTYNQDTMPPWGLPGMASQSGIFSHSLYGGPTNGSDAHPDERRGTAAPHAGGHGALCV